LGAIVGQILKFKPLLNAARLYNEEILLVGDEKILRPKLALLNRVICR